MDSPSTCVSTWCMALLVLLCPFTSNAKITLWVGTASCNDAGGCSDQHAPCCSLQTVLLISQRIHVPCGNSGLFLGSGSGWC